MLADASIPPGSAIELRVETLEQLFDPFDPFPLPTRDLSHTAEEFIVGWALELPRGAPILIRVHPRGEAAPQALKGLQEALSNHFTYRAKRMRGELDELFQIGRLSLAIGVGVLALCILGARAIQSVFGDGAAVSMIVEGLVILGWVANWRPLHLFLYEWWPLDRRRRLYQRLAAARVEIVPDAGIGGLG